MLFVEHPTIVKPTREDIAVVMYTSGSTGQPKGMCNFTIIYPILIVFKTSTLCISFLLICTLFIDYNCFFRYLKLPLCALYLLEMCPKWSVFHVARIDIPTLLELSRVGPAVTPPTLETPCVQSPLAACIFIYSQNWL